MMEMKRSCYAILPFPLLLICSGWHSGKEKQDNPKSNPLNILFLTADDMAYNSVGVYGCGIKNITPNIDRLASEGIRFTNAHINAAICQPCRQSLLTGLYPHNNGAEGF